MHGRSYIQLNIVYWKTCSLTSHDVLSRPWFLPLVLFQTIWLFNMFQIQPSAFLIIFNFDSSCSFFKVTEHNLRSTFCRNIYIHNAAQAKSLCGHWQPKISISPLKIRTLFFAQAWTVNLLLSYIYIHRKFTQSKLCSFSLFTCNKLIIIFDTWGLISQLEHFEFLGKE